ncbi:MAG: hypothetical protein HOQ34_04430 [Gemmatimonadaceae bacterium]|nr:hypothetical protein [Gemmatimonadaceae bacterium]
MPFTVIQNEIAVEVPTSVEHEGPAAVDAYVAERAGALPVVPPEVMKQGASAVAAYTAPHIAAVKADLAARAAAKAAAEQAAADTTAAPDTPPLANPEE